MDDWIFGCDVCQEVCPWNRKERRLGRSRHCNRRAPVRLLDLVELLGLDEAAFRARFRGTPLLRAQRSGLLRNAAIALGNLGDPHALPALENARADAEPLVREAAQWAIGKIREGRGEGN